MVGRADPTESVALTRALFSIASSSSLTIASCPFSAAHDSGVRPYLSCNSILAPAASSSLTIASCPFSAAHDSGV
ncbi:hypothetical protein F5Y09DRAFT_311863, partial [Xylaria sp. FL1042]